MRLSLLAPARVADKRGSLTFVNWVELSWMPLMFQSSFSKALNRDGKRDRGAEKRQIKVCPSVCLCFRLCMLGWTYSFEILSWVVLRYVVSIKNATSIPTRTVNGVFLHLKYPIYQNGLEIFLNKNRTRSAFAFSSFYCSTGVLWRKKTVNVFFVGWNIFNDFQRVLE